MRTKVVPDAGGLLPPHDAARITLTLDPCQMISFPRFLAAFRVSAWANKSATSSRFSIIRSTDNWTTVATDNVPGLPSGMPSVVAMGGGGGGGTGGGTGGGRSDSRGSPGESPMGEPPLPLAVAAGSRSRRLGSAGGSRCATCEESKGSSSSSAAASVPSLSQLVISAPAIIA